MALRPAAAPPPQVIGQALGGKTFKLKFGHHGGNHPLRHTPTGARAGSWGPGGGRGPVLQPANAAAVTAGHHCCTPLPLRAR